MCPGLCVSGRQCAAAHTKAETDARSLGWLTAMCLSVDHVMSYVPVLQNVGSGDQGAASGAADALEAVCRIVAPAIGGAVMQVEARGWACTKILVHVE